MKHHLAFGVIGKPNFSWLAKRFVKIFRANEPKSEMDVARKEYADSGGEHLAVIRGNAGLDALSFPEDVEVPFDPNDPVDACMRAREEWIDICLQFVASGEVTQERLYSLLDVYQRVDLEDYVERKKQ